MNEQPRLESIVFSLLLIVVFSLGLMKPAVPAGPVSLTFTDFVFPLLLIGWLALVVVRGRRLAWSPAYIGFAVFLVLLVPSVVFSPNRVVSLTRLAGETYLVLLAVITSQLIDDGRRLRLVVTAWLAGSVLPVGIALAGGALFYISPESPLLESITHHYGAAPMGNFPRLSSTFVSASMLCSYLTVTLVLVLVAARQSWISRALVVPAVAAVSIAAAMTVSIVLGGFFLAIALLCWWSNIGNRTVKYALAVSGFALAVAFLAIAPIDITNVPAAPGSPSSRLLIWTDALRNFIGSPIVGKGLGLPVANITYRNSDGTLSLLTDAHNTYLSIAAQTGIIGLSGLVAMITMLVRSALQFRSDDTRISIAAPLFIAFVAAFLYNGLIGSFEDARHLWVLMGLMLAVPKLKDTP